MKSPKTVSEQIELLKSRNLTIENEVEAAQILSTNNYYRLSGYWRKYQINPNAGDNNFISGTTFEEIVGIYELDAKLRDLLQKGIGVFEICFRTKFAYYMAHSGSDGYQYYLQLENYKDKVANYETPGDLLEHIKHELKRSKERYITHYTGKGESVPIWAAIEILSFGTVSKMYSRWLNKDVVKKTIEDYKILKSYSVATGVIRSLVYLRNLCAHQSRIWNRVAVVEAPNMDILQVFGNSQNRSLWRTISYLMLLVDEINQNSSFSKNVQKLCKRNSVFYHGLIKPTL